MTKSKALENIFTNHIYECNIACYHKRLQKKWFNHFWLKRYNFWLSGFSQLIIDNHKDIDVKIKFMG